MVAFFGSFLALIISVVALFRYGKRRKLGTSLTWGEAMLGALYIFGVMFLAYGIVPHQFLIWASGKYMNWRSDAKGIPAGPLRAILGKSADSHWYNGQRNVFFPNGVTFFGRGRVIVTKEAVRDALAAGLYIIFLGVHIVLWGAWQKRGQKAAQKAAIEPVSTYGRPLVKKA